MSNNKVTIFKGLKYFAIALPLLFGAPILITIGFKAIAKENKYLILVLGITLAILAIFITAKAISIILKSLFDKNDK